MTERILESEKYTDNECDSKQKGNIHQVRWKVNLANYNGNLNLEVNLNVGKEIRISFIDKFESVCLRRLECPIDKNWLYGHRNADSCGNNSIFNGTHKHTYKNRVKDGCAYTPNDIDETSIESIIRSFASECHITLNGSIPIFSTQKKLF
jgi:hypothetical protein